MSKPDQSIWGTRDTWQPAKWFYNVGGYDPVDKKAGRPRCANFSDGGDNSACLATGNTAGKIPINAPLDKSICPCGQDPLVSAFGKIAIFKNKQNASLNIIPDKVIERSEPCNWAFYTNNTGANPKQVRDRANTTQRWAPNASTSNNDNGTINPFVYYQSRSLFACIYVVGYSSWNSYNQPMWSRTMTLAQWKNNYNTMFITDVFIRLCGIESVSNDTYNYSYGQSSGHSFGVAQLDDIDGIYDYAESSYPIDQHIYLFRNHSGNGNNTASTFYLPGYGMFENEEIRGTYFAGDGGWGVHRAIPYSEKNYETIMKMVACFGIPFTDTGATQLTYTSNDMCLPMIDDNGITHGEYTRGADNVENEFYDLDSIFDWTPSGSFRDCTTLEYVSIPESVQYIGKYAFTNTALTRVRISRTCTYYPTSFPEGCEIWYYDEEPYAEESYTKAETDVLLNAKQEKLSADNRLGGNIVNLTGYTAEASPTTWTVPAATDTLNEAVKKLDNNTRLNQADISALTSVIADLQARVTALEN